jgi:hypothetical protein
LAHAGNEPDYKKECTVLQFEHLELRKLLNAKPLVLDFGPEGSPVREDMEVVTGSDSRFHVPINDAIRTATGWSDWARDFVWTPGGFNWSQEAVNGTYRVTYGFGDSLTARTQHVTIESQYIETVVQNEWDWHVNTIEVEVTDGSLDLRWASPTYSILNYLRIDVGDKGEPWFPWTPEPIPELENAPAWAVWLPKDPKSSAVASITTDNVGVSSWGDPRFDETQVHRAAIVADGIEWGIGAGTQLYSIRDNGLELVPTQRYVRIHRGSHVLLADPGRGVGPERERILQCGLGPNGTHSQRASI